MALVAVALVAAAASVALSADGWTKNIPVMKASLSQTSAVIESGLSISLKRSDLIALVVKPLVVQVGGVILFQVIGQVPFVSQLLWFARRSRKFHGGLLLVRNLIRRIPCTSGARRFFRRTLPRAFRNVPRKVVKLYKRRSRLSIASEYTNFIGNEDEE